MKSILSQLTFFAFYIILIVCFSGMNTKRCGHNLLKGIKKFETKYSQDSHEHHSNKKRMAASPWKPIRILVDYTKLNSQTAIATDAKRANLKQVIDRTAAMFQDLLYVKQGAGQLVINQACGDANVSLPTLKTGVDYDLVIFPYFKQYGSGSEGVEAAATSCAFDTTTGRPTAGFIEVNVNNFHDSLQNWLEYYTYLAFHEINHILVFNSEYFERYVDREGNPIPKTSVVGTETVNGVPRTMLITPKVVESAKKHFACSSIKGIELENQGGDGTQGSHWEMRVMLGDFMVGESYDEVVISNMSIALFEDSGWYKANYYTGGLFKHGKNAGCDFINRKCIENDQVLFPASFCKDSGAETCSPGRLSKGVCMMKDSDASVPKEFKYLSNGKVGNNNLTDFCPVSKAYDTENAKFSGNCVYGNSQLPESFKEVIGLESACFYSSVKDPKISINNGTTQNFAICYKYSCDSENKNTVVTIGSQTIQCPKAGGPVNVTDGSNTGVLFCPDYNLLCSKASHCNSLYDCVTKKVSENDVTYDYKTGQITSFESGVTVAAPEPQITPAPASYANTYSTSEKRVSSSLSNKTKSSKLKSSKTQNSSEANNAEVVKKDTIREESGVTKSQDTHETAKSQSGSGNSFLKKR